MNDCDHHVVTGLLFELFGWFIAGAAVFAALIVLATKLGV